MSQNLRETLLYQKILGCLVGGVSGDAMGANTEGKTYLQIEQTHGWIDDFEGDGTDDTVMRDLLIEAMIRTDGYADLDDWAQVMLDRWDVVFGPKSGRFFRSVLNTIHKLKTMGIPRTVRFPRVPHAHDELRLLQHLADQADRAQGFRDGSYRLRQGHREEPARSYLAVRFQHRK
jgi:hypothetical protein